MLRDHLHQIEHLMEDGDFEKALKNLEELSVLYPDNYYVASLLGECYLTIGDPQKAIKPLHWATKLFLKKKKKKALQREKTPSEESHSDEKSFVSELKKSFRQKRKSNQWIDHYLLGCAYGRTMRYAPAIKHLNIADRLNPDNTEVVRNLGWIRCMQEKKSSGRELLQRAIHLDPENALAYNDLAASYMFEENLEEAQKWIKKAIEIDPEDEFIVSTADKIEELVAYKTLFGKS